MTNAQRWDRAETLTARLKAEQDMRKQVWLLREMIAVLEPMHAANAVVERCRAEIAEIKGFIELEMG